MILLPELQDWPEVDLEASLESESSPSCFDREGNVGETLHRHKEATVEACKVEVTELVVRATEVPFAASETTFAKQGLAINLRETLTDLEARFKFKVALHRKVANMMTSVKGLQKLNGLVRRYNIPSIILVRAALTSE